MENPNWCSNPVILEKSSINQRNKRTKRFLGILFTILNLLCAAICNDLTQKYPEKQ